jgi:hypothetical protein
MEKSFVRVVTQPPDNAHTNDKGAGFTVCVEATTRINYSSLIGFAYFFCCVFVFGSHPPLLMRSHFFAHFVCVCVCECVMK